LNQGSGGGKKAPLPDLPEPPGGWQLPDSWHSGTQSDGKTYYWSDSGERQWDHPAKTAAQKEAQEAAEQEAIAAAAAEEYASKNPQMAGGSDAAAAAAGASDSGGGITPVAVPLMVPDPSAGPPVVPVGPTPSAVAAALAKTPLAPGWHEGEQADGKKYYWSDSGARQWERPVASSTGGSSSDEPHREQPLLPGWHEGTGSDGKRYYWSDSGERQWDRPFDGWQVLI